MKTSRKRYDDYVQYVIDGENKLSRPFTLRGFSDIQKVEVKNCIFDSTFSADLILIQPGTKIGKI